MTSSTSTFPYDVDACIKFIQLLKDARGMTFFAKGRAILTFNLITQSDISMATLHVSLVSPSGMFVRCLSLLILLVARLWSNIGKFLFD
jgi:hypothetical protein